MKKNKAAVFFITFSSVISLMTLVLIAVLVIGFVVNADTEGTDRRKKNASSHKVHGDLLNEDYEDIDIEDENDAREVIRIYCAQNDLDESDYSYSLITAMVQNPEERDFILGFPYREGEAEDIDTASDPRQCGIPMYIQWDERWGYKEYGSSKMGFTGCGPTCLSMVATALLGDDSLTPAFMADFSLENGYYDFQSGSGTYWSLMYDGGSLLGLDVTEIPLDEEMLIDNLEAGNPVICIMGPGVFTREGHFIVIAGYQDGKYIINDPNSIANSRKRWEFEEFSDQINCIWVFSVM